MEMKKEVSPILLIIVVIAVLAGVAYGIYRALNSTAAIMPETAGTTKGAPPATINGKPVPPGVPYDYAQKAK